MATALSSIVTMVGYELGITIDAISTPTTTEVTQWLKDAQRAMIIDFKIQYLGNRLKSEEISLAASDYNSASPSDDTIMELETALFYDAAPTPKYVPGRIVEYPAFYNLSKSGINNTTFSYLMAINPTDNKIYVYPAGASGDKLAVSYRQDIDIADTNYELHEVTIPSAVQYACFLASLQSEDAIGMAQKFYASYNELAKDFFRRGK